MGRTARRDHERRARAARALGNFAQVPEVINVLLALFRENNDDETRAFVVYALHNALPTPEVLDILITSLHESNAAE